MWQSVIALAEERQLNIKEVDEKRASFHKYCTDAVWGDARDYNLSIDTSVIGIEKTAEIILKYIND